MNIIAEIKTKGAKDTFGELFENSAIGLLTTEHSASNYGQPIALVNGKPVDYAQIERITLREAGKDIEGYRRKLRDSYGDYEPKGVSAAEYKQVAEALRPFGIKVIRG